MLGPIILIQLTKDLSMTMLKINEFSQKTKFSNRMLRHLETLGLLCSLQ